MDTAKCQRLRLHIQYPIQQLTFHEQNLIKQNKNNNMSIQTGMGYLKERKTEYKNLAY